MKKLTLSTSLFLALQLSSADAAATTTQTTVSSSSTTQSHPVIPLNAETALVYIRNENAGPITILFKPQVMGADPSVNASDRIEDRRAAGFVSVTIPENSFIEVVVKQKDLGKDVNLFSVTGEADSSGPLGTANNLSYGKIYVVRFTKNAFGTSCFTEELKEPIANFPQVQAQGVRIRKESPTPGGEALPTSPCEVKPSAGG